MIRLDQPTVMDLCWLALNMREDEKDQWCALTNSDGYDPDMCARGLIAIPGPCWALIDTESNQAIVAGGFEPIRPMVWQTWMAGTDQAWEKHWRRITKETRLLMDGLFAEGVAHRIQCYGLASRTAAHEWYARGMRLKFEGVHSKLYADGRDAVCYARVK